MKLSFLPMNNDFFLFHLMQAKGRETGWPVSLEKQPEERHGHICKVCFEAPTAAVLLPCRHFCCKFYSIILLKTYIFVITIEYKPVFLVFSLLFCSHMFRCISLFFPLLFLLMWSYWVQKYRFLFVVYHSMIMVWSRPGIFFLYDWFAYHFFFIFYWVNMIQYRTNFLYVIEVYYTLWSLKYISLLNALCPKFSNVNHN